MTCTSCGGEEFETCGEQPTFGILGYPTIYMVNCLNCKSTKAACEPYYKLLEMLEKGK